MWSSKKFIIVLVLAAVLAIVSIGGVVLAQENGDEDGAQPEARHAALLERVCAIYEDNTGTAIDSEEMQNAFAQAQSEMHTAAMEARLAKMVENGVLDETQAQELQEWLEDMPEDLPFGPGLMAPRGERPFGEPGCGFQGGDRLPPYP